MMGLVGGGWLALPTDTDTATIGRLNFVSFRFQYKLFIVSIKHVLFCHLHHADCSMFGALDVKHDRIVYHL